MMNSELAMTMLKDAALDLTISRAEVKASVEYGPVSYAEAVERLAESQGFYDLWFQRYTNPFNVNKWV